MTKRKVISTVLLSIVALIILLVIVGGILIGVALSKVQPELMLSQSPYKTNYYIGEQLQLDGLKVLYYKNLMSKPQEIDISDLTITGFDSSVACETQTITVIYGSCSTQFIVSINDYPQPVKVVASIELQGKNGSVIKKVYTQFEKLQLDQLQLKVTYTDGTTSVVEATDSKVEVLGQDLWQVTKGHEVTFVYERCYTTLIVDVVAQPATE